MKFRDRIVGLRRVRAGDLRANPRNWRTHPESQRDALRALLEEVGWANAVLAREQPDGSLILIDGHLRTDTAPDSEVPVLVLDVTEAEADKLLLSLDPLSQMAESNAKALDDLLRDVNTGSPALAGMFEGLAEANGLLGDGEPEIKESRPKPPPPEMAWVLIGLPIVKFGAVQRAIDEIAAVPDATILTTYNDRRDDAD